MIHLITEQKDRTAVSARMKVNVIPEHIIPTPRPSRISMVIDLDTTSLEARSFAVGAYRSINRSPSLFLRIPPSPRDPTICKNKKKISVSSF